MFVLQCFHFGTAAMPDTNKVLAWVEPHGDGEFLAAFVSGSSSKARPPATRVCASEDETRRWVAHEAAALGTTVRWMTRDKK